MSYSSITRSYTVNLKKEKSLIGANGIINYYMHFQKRAYLSLNLNEFWYSLKELVSSIIAPADLKLYTACPKNKIEEVNCKTCSGLGALSSLTQLSIIW